MLHCLFARAEEEFTRCASCGNRAAKAHLTAPRRGEAAQRLIGAASRFHARTWRRCWACGSAAGFMRCIGRNSNSTAVAQQPPASSSSSVGPGCILCIPDVQPAKDRVHGHGPRLPVPEGGLVNARANRDRGGAKDSQSSAARNAWPNCAPLSSTSSQKSEPPSLSFRFHVQMITSHSSRILNREGREAMPRWCRLAEQREWMC